MISDQEDFHYFVGGITIQPNHLDELDAVVFSHDRDQKYNAGGSRGAKMPNGRKPGSECHYLNSVELDDGTMCRQLSPTPGPSGAHLSDAPFSISRMSSNEKLRKAILHACHNVSPEISEKLLALATPETITIIAGTAGIWAAGHFFGVSEAADLALVGIGVVALGSEAITAGRELVGFVTLALHAQRESELDEAGRHLARFIAIVGVDTAIALLLHKAGSRGNRMKGSVLDGAKPVFVELKPGIKVELRTDISLSGAGRSGENVKFLLGPGSSAVKSVGRGRVFVTNASGRVILDMTAERVKPVSPNLGFGEKRPPTDQELNLIKLLWGE